MPTATKSAGSAAPVTTGSLRPEHVWRALAKGSFAVIGYVTPTGRPRSSGVLYTVLDRRLYVVTDVDSWKARDIPATGRVAVTVPVRRGGIMSLLFAIPPATISFHGTASVFGPETPLAQGVLKRLGRLLPAERRDDCRIIEIRPVGRFQTYGIGVDLLRMRDPSQSRAHVPVA